MSRSSSVTGVPRQRPLLFTLPDGPAEPWAGLTEHQRLECRRALRQMLVAVARQARGAGGTHPGPPDQRPEVPSHD